MNQRTLHLPTHITGTKKHMCNLKVLWICVCVCVCVCVSNQWYRFSLNISTYLRDIDEAHSVLTGVYESASLVFKPPDFFMRARPRSACKLGLHTPPHPHTHTHIPEHTQEFFDTRTVSDTRIWILHVFWGCGRLVYFCNLGKQWSSVCVLSHAGFLETVRKLIFHLYLRRRWWDV